MKQQIGVLALQGDFAKHLTMLESLGAAAFPVKKPEELQRCDGLIIPGGESTTLTKLMRRGGWYEPLREFARHRPVMGTCAGMIMVANEVDDKRVTPLELIDIAVNRNAYGRQINSFITALPAPCLGENASYRAIFIRAPQIRSVGRGIEVLMECDGRRIMVRNRNILALAFHPELTDDPRIHRYFLDMEDA